MVLDRSDYNLSNLYRGNFDPSNPGNFAGKFVGGLFVLTLLMWMIGVARAQGVPLMDQIVARLTGGRVSTEGSAPQVF